MKAITTLLTGMVSLAMLASACGGPQLAQRARTSPGTISIPQVDAEAPAVTETAFFALG